MSSLLKSIQIKTINRLKTIKNGIKSNIIISSFMQIVQKETKQYTYIVILFFGTFFFILVWYVELIYYLLVLTFNTTNYFNLFLIFHIQI